MPREMIAGDKVVYCGDWNGVPASRVLSDIAKDPPPYLLRKFDKIIHIDCSRWKSRRALQRTIVQELKLPRQIIAILDTQDEYNDSIGMDESSRRELPSVAAEINKAMRDHSCLVFFNNGSGNTIDDLYNFGIPLLAGDSTHVLWSFAERLPHSIEINEKRIYPNTVEEAVEVIIPYLDDTSNNVHKIIYFDGWCGMAASVVLRAIAKEPCSSLLRKFNKIVHVDCSRWKSRRELQRVIAKELKLPQQVMDVLDSQDEEDDFTGIDQGSRAEIKHVGAEIHRALREDKFLVVFHNGSNTTIDLDGFGIPLSSWFGNKVLWTFRGRLRHNSEISKKVDISHLYLYDMFSNKGWNFLLQNEAREIARYTTDKLGKAVEECCLYLLSLNSQGGNIIDYNWSTHASNYWVCDGIIKGGHTDKAWEAAAALHQQIHLGDYSSNTIPSFAVKLETPPKRWILARNNCDVHPESTSFFFPAVTSISNHPLRPLPNGMFHQSEKLRVLKLCHCTFSFSSPPFHCCHKLRFLGLDGCKDQRAEEDEKQDTPAMDFLKSIWVLDICYTDWELDLSPKIIEHMAANIREVHISNGKFWHMSFAWRLLQNLSKLQVIDPTCSWEMGGKDELTVFPYLSTSNSLKTLVLEGCSGLEHVEGLPLSLESFCLDADPRKGDYKEAKIIRISMAGCAKLSDFRLRGSLPKLEELDLSGTSIKTLDMKDQVVEIPCLKRVMLLGCQQLCVVLWPNEGMPCLSELCIDTRERGEIGRIMQGSKMLEDGYCQAYVAMKDMRFIQSLVLISGKTFCWNYNRFSLNICISIPSTNGEHSLNREKMSPSTSGIILEPPQPKSLISNHCYNTYHDITIDNMTIDHDRNKSVVQFQRSSCHVEIGEGISNTRAESVQGMRAIIFVMNKAVSLHVHDNSSITTVIPEHMISIEGEELFWEDLKQCCVVRCPNVHTVFAYDHFCSPRLKNFWAADLLMAHSIWSKRRTTSRFVNNSSFYSLQSIHLYSCPRLTFVLQLWRSLSISYFPNLETLHIVNCGGLKYVFPLEATFSTEIATGYTERVLRFPNLKHIYLHELYKLQDICEAKMFAPKLVAIRVRGCWGLKRIPAIRRDHRPRPVVDCEKDWWENLEWDGVEAGHDPALFEPRHSSYYKKPMPRVSVLR